MQQTESLFPILQELLTPQEGHVRALVVPNDDPLVGGFSSFLSKQQRARCRRFFRAEDRRAASVCKGLWRLGAGVLSECEPRGVRMGHDCWNRPVISGTTRDEIDLNVSRTLTHCALVVGRGVRVGVDIEQICPELISPSLVEAITGSGDHDRREALAGDAAAFFDYWTKKEAVLKGDGRGLEVDPRGVHVPFGCEQSPGAWGACSCEEKPWFVTRLTCPDLVCGCVGADREPVLFEQVEWARVQDLSQMRGTCASGVARNT